MPTISCQPSLLETQAVGAVLLHQFARERFIEAGLSEDLLREAESQEKLDTLTATLLQDDQQGPENVTTNGKCNGHTDDDTANDSTLVNYSGSTTSPLESTHQLNNSNNNISTTSEDVATPDQSTIHHVTQSSDAGEQFHSVANMTTNINDNTIYHSVNAGKARETCLDRAQSLSIMSSYGRELRRIAEDFEKTQLRQEVKDKANNISLADINKDTFMQLLEELFHDGVSRVKIVTLFFFCTDVAVRAASFAHELVVKLLGWSFSYIVNIVCRVIHDMGGWESVLFRQIPSVLITCCAVLGIAALTVYLRKNLSLKT